ncbi:MULTISPECIES: ectonucleotide pyrophosphatase/phosphodiesterase [unclassified Imperialibacter]|uniref:alkaline phosphatase family protein n=1 Tax=unclassified Imperialibacter TaxID=2629706 RepID=UPI0012542539|nr:MULTISPECIES: ectonucleotide pyrophosphatase/phosphodiesterase [unclassified Imperialibacter]CAD5250642.1 Alkaline phosphatase family protein [Imperialibacter sp. 75]CAD5286229.1 Alkaline phosphatase family protein [Imperialibacter sp. 89]VVT05375.1 Alkaline phosphatase family protein [Imperialibacter sp. EC-SDR9]
MTKRIALFLLFAALAVISESCTSGKKQEPYVLLISFDGFRHDYVNTFQPPHFLEFIEEGTAAKAMIPSFPSKTFPNHYTIVTGMYPGHHGLVDNTFYDSTQNVVYTMGKRELVQDAFYYGGLPLWQLAQQQGLKSASYFWVGSEAPVAGFYPDYYEIYDGDVPNEARIKKVVEWLQLPESERPRFISLYFSLVDSEGHSSGPNSGKLKETVLEADRLLGLIDQKIAELDLPVNIIVTSDHGMYEMTETAETFIYLDSLFAPDDSIKFANSGPIVHVYEDDSTRQEQIFQSLAAKETHFKTYRRKDTPNQWHYDQHPRIGDLLLVMEPGYYFRNGSPDTTKTMMDSPWGVHGFDPYVTPEMGAIFYAKGPNIQKGLLVPPFENVHVYPLVAKILGLTTPSNIDGDPDVLMKAFVE